MATPLKMALQGMLRFVSANCHSFPTAHDVLAQNSKLSSFIFCQAALDHLIHRTDIDTSRIVVFGRSLGGAVGSVLAQNNPDTVSLGNFLVLYMHVVTSC